MSIYATALALALDAHDDDCPARKPGRRTRRARQVRPDCSCGRGAPLVYQRSHVLPGEDDDRDGTLLLCEIPGFISRGPRQLCGDDAVCSKPLDMCCDRVWPYLRIALHNPDGDAVAVLDYRQVERVHAYLGEWLKRADPKAA